MGMGNNKPLAKQQKVTKSKMKKPPTKFATGVMKKSKIDRDEVSSARMKTKPVKGPLVEKGVQKVKKMK